MDLMDLVDGKYGKVVQINDWDMDKCVSLYNGKEWKSGEVVGEVVEWLGDKNIDDLVVVKDDGYRGICCYGGWIEVDSNMFWLDFMNEGVVYEMSEIIN